MLLHVFASTIHAGFSAIAFCFASAASITTGTQRDGCFLSGIAAVLFLVRAIAIAVFVVVIVIVALVVVCFL